MEPGNEPGHGGLSHRFAWLPGGQGRWWSPKVCPFVPGMVTSWGMAALVVLIVFSAISLIALVPRYLKHIERMKELEVRRLEALGPGRAEQGQARAQLASELLEAYDELHAGSDTTRPGLKPPGKSS